MQRLEVTAPSGLNIRRLPENGAGKLAAMPPGMIVELLEPRLWNNSWYRIRAEFSRAGVVEGYSSSSYLRPVNGDSLPTPSPSVPAESPQTPLEKAIASTPAYAWNQLNPMTEANVARRYENELHMAFLERIQALLEKCKRNGLSFRLFEAYRQPSRQAELYNSSRYGRRITNADAWQSIHNYGFAADIILNVKNVNPWETGKVGGVDYMKQWLKMRDFARGLGLKTLTDSSGADWDLPHVQMPDMTWRALQAGQFPTGGGATWAANLLRNIQAHPSGAPSDISKLTLGGADMGTVVPGADTATDTSVADEQPSVPEVSRLEVLNSVVPAEIVAGFFHPTAKRNVERYLPLVLDALREFGIDTWPQIIVALGTINAESAGFASIPEGQSQYNTAPGGAPFALYDNRSDIGNQGPGDGARFKGRGFVQLTGRDNYKKYGPKVGVDLIADPDAALDPKTAARILAAFMSDKDERIQKAWENQDWKDARRAVNGGTHGQDRFEAVIHAARNALDWTTPI